MWGPKQKGSPLGKSPNQSIIAHIDRGPKHGEKRREMEENGHGSGDRSHWWWALASAAQLGWGVFSYRRGGVGDSRLMPVKAFGVASLFVGAAASAAFGVLHASGIHKVYGSSPSLYYIFQDLKLKHLLWKFLFAHQSITKGRKNHEFVPSDS